MHGDWMNGWKQEAVDTFTRGFLKARLICHSHLLGDDREMY
jgi:hypothetical protein